MIRQVKKLTFIGIAILLGLCATPAYAQLDLPHAFYGSLEINGNPAPKDTKVEAKGTGVEATEGNPIYTGESGYYGSEDPLGSKLTVQGSIAEGATIEFYVDDVKANETAIWHTGYITELPLTVTTTAPAGGGGGGGGGAADTTPPVISDVLLCEEGVTETTADICWVTSELSTSQVEYWTSPSMKSELDETLRMSHHVQLTGLTPGTTYHYKTISKDRAGNLTVSPEFTFTTLGEAPAAVFTSSDLSISPSEVAIEESVTISVLVTNTGNLSGSYEVTLKIDGEVEATKTVTVAADGSRSVSFTVSRDEAATYSVDVNGLKGSFTVTAEAAPPVPAPVTPPVTPEEAKPVNWPVIGGIIAAVVVAGAVAFYLIRRRRAY
jgi:hypothetical protein